MNDRRKDALGDGPLRRALDLVSMMGEPGWTYVPAEPTKEMLRAGSAAGNISQHQALRIYTAMLREA